MRAQRFVWILCTSLAVAFALRFIVAYREKLPAPQVRSRANALDTKQHGRKIYPFSVIPGGAYSAEELALARRVDGIVAAHYIDFDASAVAVRTLPEAEFLYVSYRKANRVFWTTDKHRIPKGELVLTDNKHLARTRCGNRLSAVPQFPVLYGPQPTDALLNAPELPGGLELPQAPLFAAAYDAPMLPMVDDRPRVFGYPREVTGASPYVAFPAVPSNFPLMVVANAPFPGVSRPRIPTGSTGGGGGGGVPTAGGGGGPGGGPGGPVVGIIPEPSAVYLIGAGMLILASMARWRKRPIRTRSTRRSFRPDTTTNA